MRIIVTGAAGMIGSNLVHGLNAAGVDDVIAVDDMGDGAKFRNLLGARIADYLDKDEFYPRFARGEFGDVEAVFHEGACSDTMEQDGKYMMQVNYRCSKELMDSCRRQQVRLIYASSAATYGDSQISREQPEHEKALNVYGFSKLLFDNVVRRALREQGTQISGLRYFNVYGPREAHKGRMASVAFHHFNQYRDKGHVELFGEYGGYAAGQQERDFVYVGDVVRANLWFLQHPGASGIFNVGTGKAEPFNSVAVAMVNACAASRSQPLRSLAQLREAQIIRYVPMPPALVGKYQCHTEADLRMLRAVGCDIQFCDVQQGTTQYSEWLLAQA